jgi:hypothetical protein
MNQHILIEVIGIPEVVVAMGMFLTVVVDELVTFV